MASEEITEILTSPDKKVGDAKDALSKLFRIIMADTNLTGYRWDALMTRYLDDPYNHVPKNAKDRSVERGNLNKHLKRPTMTWKVFMKALRFLAPIKIRFEVHLTWANKRTTIHHLDIKTRSGHTVEDIADYDRLVNVLPKDDVSSKPSKTRK